MEEAKTTNVMEQFTLLVALVVVVMYGHVQMTEYRAATVLTGVAC